MIRAIRVIWGENGQEIGRKKAQEARKSDGGGRERMTEDGFFSQGHGVLTQRKQESDGGQTTGKDFTEGNGENGGCFFIRAIRVIRGEKVWNVGRKKAQKAQESEDGRQMTDGGGRTAESDFVTETTEC
jgi:hypothetical protein